MLNNKGFTLFELLLVVSIGAVIFLFSAPYGLNFYRSQLAEEARSNIIDGLQRAKHNAVLQKNDSNFGVTLGGVPHSYVIFQGSNYETRDSSQDEVFLIIEEINFSGLSEVAFSKLTGLPSITGSIYINYGSVSKGIMIEDSGVISKII